MPWAYGRMEILTSLTLMVTVDLVAPWRSNCLFLEDVDSFFVGNLIGQWNWKPQKQRICFKKTHTHHLQKFKFGCQSPTLALKIFEMNILSPGCPPTSPLKKEAGPVYRLCLLLPKKRFHLQLYMGWYRATISSVFFSNPSETQWNPIHLFSVIYFRTPKVPQLHL